MINSGIQIWAVGSIGIDAVQTRDVARRDLLGGSLPYATAAGSFTGARFGAVGVIGSDFPEALSMAWQKFGCDLAGVQVKPGPTFRWSCRYDDNMIDRTTLDTQLGVFADFSPELPAAYRAAPFVLLGNIQPDLQLHVLDQAAKPRFIALDTMDLWINTARKSLMKAIARADLLTLNDGEARALTGLWALPACAEAILKMGPRYVLIKKGEHGAMLFGKEGTFLVPAYPVKTLVDPTGAGDTYIGAFMGSLAQAPRVSFQAMRKALLYAAVVASFGVEGFSLDRFATLDGRQIAERLRALYAMVRI